MGEVALRKQELTDRQRAFAEAYAELGDVAVASEVAGYADETGGREALRSKLVQTELRERRKAIIEQKAAAEAMTTMRELMKPGNPPATRFSASKWILEAAGYGAKDRTQDDEVPLAEMSEAQLVRFMAKAQAVVDAGGEPPIIAVTPDSGALPAEPGTGDGLEAGE